MISTPTQTQAEYTIRELADRFDVTARTLRFYEQKGLLSPKRRGAARIYSAADAARLDLILRGRRVGFSLEEIKEMQDLERLDEGSRLHLEAALDRFRDRIATLQRQRADIDNALKELTAGCRWMEERLADREPPEDIKRRARAFEALAAARLEEWTSGSAE
ncbi:MAG: MerR family DNA-binding transcriptional regulator [Oceanicaulis sp.]